MADLSAVDGLLQTLPAPMRAMARNMVATMDPVAALRTTLARVVDAMTDEDATWVLDGYASRPVGAVTGGEPAGAD